MQDAEKLWLDGGLANPESVAFDSHFAEVRNSVPWRKDIAQAFSRWLNDSLKEHLPVGDIEEIFWHDIFDEESHSGQINGKLSVGLSSKEVVNG